MPDMAEATRRTRLSRRAAAVRVATFRRPVAPATEVPPNFMTRMPAWGEGVRSAAVLMVFLATKKAPRISGALVWMIRRSSRTAPPGGRGW